MSAGKDLVDGARQAEHGDPVPNMERFAKLVGAYVGIPLDAHDGAMIALLLKVSRVRANPTLPDNYDDIEGYTEIARRCAGVVDQAAEAQRRTGGMT